MNELVLEEERLFFWLVTGQSIRSIRQLIEIVPTLTDEQYWYHVNEYKCDFYNWIKDVFNEPEIAELIKSSKTRDEFQEKLYLYLLEEKKRQQSKVKEKFDQAEKVVLEKDSARFAEYHVRQAREKERVADEFDAAAKRFDERKNVSVLPKIISRLDALRERERELRAFITETRKEGHDPFFSMLLLRRFAAKAEYAKLSESDQDINKAEQVLNEVEHELEEAVMAKFVDARKEVAILVDILKAKETKQAGAAGKSAGSAGTSLRSSSGVSA